MLDFTVQRPCRRHRFRFRLWNQELYQDLATGFGFRTCSQDLASVVGMEVDLQDLLWASVPVSFGTSEFSDVL